MKAILLSLTGLMAGFVSARWIPAPGPAGVSTEISALAPASRQRPPAAAVPKKSTRSLNLEGDWRPELLAWAKEDPAGLRDWLVERGIPPGEEKLEALFREWVARDADAAFEAVFNLPGDFNRENDILSNMLNELLKKPEGLAAALKWAPQVEEQIHGWTWPSDAWFKKMPPETIAAQLEEAVRHRGSTGYTASMAQMLARHWADTDAAAALDWAHSLPQTVRGGAATGVITAWTRKDPQAVLKYLAGEATSAERWNAHIPLGKLAETDPRAAMDWWEVNRGVPDPNCIPHIYNAWCKTNENEARDYAMGMEDPVLRRDCLAAWATSAKPEGVWEAFRTAGDAELRTSLLTSMTTKFRGESSDARELRQLITDGKVPEATPAIASSLASSMSWNDPSAAFAWASSLTGPLQSAGVTAAANAWAQKDQVAAAQAVAALPEGPVKTAAAAALSGKP